MFTPDKNKTIKQTNYYMLVESKNRKVHKGRKYMYVLNPQVDYGYNLIELFSTQPTFYDEIICKLVT